MATVDVILSGTIGEVNEGLGFATGALNPLAAQLDLSLSLGLSALQSNIRGSLSAAVGVNASLTVSFDDPLAALRASLFAAIELQASLTLALSLPPLVLPEIALDLAASASLVASLSFQLGGIDLAIQGALAIKIPAQRLAADLNVALGLGPMVLLAFDGLADGTSMQDIGDLIATKFSSSLGTPQIDPPDPISGIIIITTATAAYAALNVVFPI